MTNPDDKHAPEGFTYRATRDGTVFISHHGRMVTTLRGAAAAKFVQRVERADELEAQHLMARATGHYSHGNKPGGRG